LISLNFLVVGLRIASLGLMYVVLDAPWPWLWPSVVFVFSSKRGIGFSSMPPFWFFVVLSGDWDLVGEDEVLGERSERGFVVVLLVALVGDMTEWVGGWVGWLMGV
jgi:hypothetical protein